MELNDLLGRPERWASVLGWATLAGIEFGLIGPFGSYASHLSTRLIYWTLLFWTGSLLLWPCVVMALAAGARRGFPPIFSGIAVILVACVPLAVLGAIGTHMFWPLRASGMRTLDFYGLTLVVALPAMAGLLWVELGRSWLIAAWRGRSPDSRLLAEGEDDPAALAAGGAALPDHLIATALCLQMEDHHVRVHLHGRSVLHHGVMRQIVETMDEARGLQVHRSWWVARDAVRGWQRDGRSVSLTLANGLKVPVARNRVALLRERGWLDADREDQAAA